MFIDTHCHLLDGRFNGDRDAVIKRASAHGVGRMIEVACSHGEWENALDFARGDGMIACALGIHPHEARLAAGALLSRLEDLARDPLVLAVGETGLDYYYLHSPKESQRDAFLRQCAIARRLAKPVVIHCRQAYDDLIALLKEDRTGGGPVSGVVHCFSGTLSEALTLAELGFFIGIDAPVTYPGARALHETVKHLPIERFVLETDSPYLPPRDFRGERNEPSHLPLIAAAVARIKGLPVEEVAARTTENARTLFNIP